MRLSCALPRAWRRLAKSSLTCGRALMTFLLFVPRCHKEEWIRKCACPFPRVDLHNVDCVWGAFTVEQLVELAHLVMQLLWSSTDEFGFVLVVCPARVHCLVRPFLYTFAVLDPCRSCELHHRKPVVVSSQSPRQLQPLSLPDRDTTLHHPVHHCTWVRDVEDARVLLRTCASPLLDVLSTTLPTSCRIRQYSVAATPFFSEEEVSRDRLSIVSVCKQRHSITEIRHGVRYTSLRGLGHRVPEPIRHLMRSARAFSPSVGWILEASASRWM